MRPTKILFVVDNYPPAFGGVARSAHRLVTGFVTRGVNVVVLTIDPLIRENPQPDNDNSSKEPTNPVVVRVKRFPKDRDQLHELKYVGEKIVLEVRPDLIIGFFIYRAGFIATYLGQRYQTPVLLSIRGNDLEISPFNPERHSMVIYALRYSNAITSVSQELLDTAHALEPLTNQTCKVVFNGIDLSIAHQRKDRFLGEEGRLVVGFLGDERRKKGLMVLVKALKTLTRLEEKKKWLLRVAGPVGGKKKQVIREMVGEPKSLKVSFEGEIPPTEVEAFYTTLDLLVIPSLWDGMPNVLLEGVARKVPTIVSDIACMREYFPATCVTFFESDNPTSLARALQWVRSNPEAASQKAKSARKHLEKNYRQEHEFDRWMKVIDDL